jgi:hypothetical protein
MLEAWEDMAAELTEAQSPSFLNTATETAGGTVVSQFRLEKWNITASIRK